MLLDIAILMRKENDLFSKQENAVNQNYFLHKLNKIFVKYIRRKQRLVILKINIGESES